MWRIRRGLFLGDGYDAKDRDLLRSAGITHIINCAAEVPCWHRRDFRYLHLKLRDPDPDFHEHIDRCVKFIRRGRRAGGVLVHCLAGLSRSPSVILAYLCARGSSLPDALDHVGRAVGETQEFILPDATFLSQIELYLEDRDPPA
ncbi:MAG: dual specificity protein phosphatase [Planctomycetaceae bacterium]